MPILNGRIEQFVRMTSDICEKGEKAADGRVGNHLILPIYLSDGTRAESTEQDRGIADNVAKCLRSLRKQP